ncbi:MAG: hypothetical protein OEV42_14675 [Deltaproteobacteria bacterium]|nr:hypothetical protein [Deltaproteobacteria bacterium]
MRKRPKITENKFDKFASDLKEWIADSVSPFENDSPEKQEARKARAGEDLLFFCKTYLPHYFPSAFGEFHEEWEEVTELEDEVFLLGAPREHAKSTFFSFAVPLWHICYQRKRFQLLISDTSDQAKGFTLPVRMEIEDNPRIKNDFGNMRGSRWQEGDFFANHTRLLARGHGDKVRGLKYKQYRPDYACVDDFENDENVENPKQVIKGLKWLRRSVIGSMGLKYLFVMVGNLFHPKAILSQLIAEKDEDGSPLYLSKVYQAWIDYGKADQRPLWPANWSPERLEKKKRTMGTRDFNAEMMNLVGDEDSPFPESWFKYFERSHLAGKTLQVASFDDPSAKNGEANDYKAIVTVGLDRTEMKFYCLHAWIRRTSPSGMFEAAYRLVDEYGGVIGIEENMLHDFLHDAIINYAKEVGRFLPWMPVIHSTNKEARIIGTLSYLVEHGRLLFERGHSDQDLLIEQLIYLLNKNINDDGPDALEGAVKLLQGKAAPQKVHTSGPRETEAMTAGYC